MVQLVSNNVNVLSDEELDILAVQELKEDGDKLAEDIVSCYLHTDKLKLTRASQ